MGAKEGSFVGSTIGSSGRDSFSSCLSYEDEDEAEEDFDEWTFLAGTLTSSLDDDEMLLLSLLLFRFTI